MAQRRAADLVKLLALAPGHRMPRDELLEMLWPKLGADPAPSNLHKAASYARRALMRRRGWRAVTGQLPRQLRLLPDELSRLGAEPSEETLALPARARARPGGPGARLFRPSHFHEI
ncbi:MAG TPA: hypothetical protein VIM03_04710 [Thermoleophilaceae bacterium]